MALTIKHTGRGKYQVLDGDTVIAKGLEKEHAQAVADGNAPVPEGAPAENDTLGTEEYPVDGEIVVATQADDPIPMRDENGEPLSEAQRRRLYEKRLETGRRAENDKFLAPYKAMVERDFDEDTAAAIWRQIEPVLQAGHEGVRRNLGRNMRIRGG